MENRNCQNCKNDFEITSDDFSFYAKIKVPPPTFCPWCRFVRRLVWRNERTLYKRNCTLCNKSMISMYPTGTPFPVYCHDCWFGDSWDADMYGQDYDFSKSFFSQFKELQNKVPRFALWQRNCTNSEYANMVAESKNIYLSVSATSGCENVFYSKSIDASFNIFDSLNMKNSDTCYENTNGERNYNTQHTLLSRNCIDSFFLVDCANCSNCFMSSNLRNKQYYIRNKQYSKEEYQAELEKINFGSKNVQNTLLNEFKILKDNATYRFANIVQAQNATGNNLSNVKNCQYSFDVYDSENYKYSYRTYTSKDCMDYDYGQSSELMYEYLTGSMNDSNVKFSYSAMGNVRDADYTDSCSGSANLFGCISLKKKENAILNKVYGKAEYESLRSEIIEHMNTMPYVDEAGRSYSYGEFFPFEISPFAYNETVAQDMDPLTKALAVEKFYKWRDVDDRMVNVTVSTKDIPDDIKEVGEDILNHTLGCAHGGNCNHQCSVGFRITAGELQFYKSHNIPLPDRCANCRYYERFTQLPLPKLYDRVCMKCNVVKFQTPYAPDRPEKIYCESCYNKEIY